MNAGTKYLFDSLMGLMMEVANLRTLVEQKDARIAELEKPKPDLPDANLPAEAM